MVKRFMQKTMEKEPLDSGLVQDLRQLRVTNCLEEALLSVGVSLVLYERSQSNGKN